MIRGKADLFGLLIRRPWAGAYRIQRCLLWAAALWMVSTPSVFAADPVARWVASDWSGSGNWLDRVGSKAATPYGSNLPAKASNQFSNLPAGSDGITFDGTSYFEIAGNSNPVRGAPSLTVVAVFKTSTPATYIDGSTVNSDPNHWQFAGPVNAEAPGNPNDFGLCYDSAGNARAFFNAAIVPASSVNLTNGLTRTLILTWGASSTSQQGKAKFYVDGVQQAEITSDSGLGIHQGSSRPIRFGRDIENQRGFKGVLSEVRFYTSIEDAVALHNSLTNNPPTISVIADQSTNEETPTTAIPFTVGDVETAAGSLRSQPPHRTPVSWSPAESAWEAAGRTGRLR